MTISAVPLLADDGAPICIAAGAQGEDQYLAQNAYGDDGHGQFVKGDAGKNVGHMPVLLVSCCVSMKSTYWRKGAE